jgi:hypothetical protein
MDDQPITPRIYVATKMSGLSYEEIMDKCHRIADICDYSDCEIINVLPKEVSVNWTPVECLGESIKALAHADVVIIEKYEETRGVSCEEYICNKYKIPYFKVFLSDVNTHSDI